MKIIYLFFILLIPFNAFSQKNVDYSYSKTNHYLLNWKAIYSGLNDGQNEGLDVFGLESYGRYAFDEKVGLNFSMTKFVTSNSGYIVENGAVGTRVSLGFSYALTGSLLQRTDYFKKTSHSFKEKKHTKVETLYKRHNKFNGWKMDLSLSTMNLNAYDKNILLIGPSVYYEHKFKKVVLQYGMRHDFHLSDRNVDINFTQGFIAIGFMP